MTRVRKIIVAVEKETSLTYSEGVFVALGTQHAMRLHHVIMCGLSGSTIFFLHNFTNGTIKKKKSFWK